MSSQSEVGKIKRILIKHARDAFVSQDNLDGQWGALNYSGQPNYNKALEEYEALVDLLKQHVDDIEFLPQNDKVGIDSIYARDSSIVTDKGVILCNMGKTARQGEPTAIGDYLKKIGVKVLGAIFGEGRLEGGDLVWQDERTLVIGRGYRTNDEGIQQLKELTTGLVDEFIVVPLPHWRGPDDVFHLMSFISPIDHDLAVVYSPLMPVPFREWLIDRGVQLVEVPGSEYRTMACNILALEPRRATMLDGNPITKRLLEEQGVEVWTYKGDEISRKGAGGPTCLTRPLVRE